MKAKRETIHDLAIQLSGEMSTWLQEREEKLLGEHGYRVTADEMIMLRLTLVDVVAVASIVAAAMLIGADAELLLQTHSRHVREGIRKVEARWEE